MIGEAHRQPMSPIGTKRRWRRRELMSANPPEPDIGLSAFYFNLYFPRNERKPKPEYEMVEIVPPQPIIRGSERTLKPEYEMVGIAPPI